MFRTMDKSTNKNAYPKPRPSLRHICEKISNITWMFMKINNRYEQNIRCAYSASTSS